MKYFKFSLWEDMNSKSDDIQKKAEIEWEKNSLEYNKIYNDKVKKQLPKLFTEKFDEYYGFHDWHIFSIHLNFYENKIEIVLDKRGVKKTLIYSGIKMFSSNWIAFNDDIWGYSEILAIGREIYSHEILLSSSKTIYIEFRDILIL